MTKYLNLYLLTTLNLHYDIYLNMLQSYINMNILNCTYLYHITYIYNYSSNEKCSVCLLIQLTQLYGSNEECTNSHG